MKHPLLLALVFFSAATFVPAQSGFPDDGGARVAAILQNRCAQCHSRDLETPKGDFGGVEDLNIVREDYVEPGNLDRSDLWEHLTSTDEEEKMPPAKAKNGPLLPEELALIRWWILEGAPVPEKTEAASDDHDHGGDHDEVNVIATLGRFHPLLIHFPIALLLVAALAELWALVGGGDRSAFLRRFALLTGSLAAVLAVGSGLIFEESHDESNPQLVLHRVFGIATASLAVVALVVDRFGGPVWLRRLIVFAVAAVVGITGHLGGQMVFGEGFPF
ncbi:MAG TPA: hypothetical protein ENK43_03265 [Planctomycetes bacterium]|nr:hypothetical protein [Planctomycetota bacterium]